MLQMFMVRIGALKDEAEKKEEIAEEEKQNSSENVERKDLSFYLCSLVTILITAKFCSLSCHL